jgi:hypothetical protein
MTRTSLSLGLIAVLLTGALAPAAIAGDEDETSEGGGPPIVGQIDEDGGISPGDLGGLPGCGGFCMPSDPHDPGTGPGGDDDPDLPGGPGPGPGPDPEPDPDPQAPLGFERACVAMLVEIDPFKKDEINGPLPNNIAGLKTDSLRQAFAGAHTFFGLTESVCPGGTGPTLDDVTREKFRIEFEKLFNGIGPDDGGCSQFVSFRLNATTTLRMPDFLEVEYQVDGSKAGPPTGRRCYRFKVGRTPQTSGYEVLRIASGP